MLLPGDVEGAAATLIANTLDVHLQSTVYKMAHHGASTLANSDTWLKPIRPISAFASSGYNFSNCRHPRCLTIQRIEKLNTIGTVPAHMFYCGNPPGQDPTPLPNYTLSMYATSPTANLLCRLVYQSSYHLVNDCTLILQPSDDIAALDDHNVCPEEDQGEGDLDYIYYE